MQNTIIHILGKCVPQVLVFLKDHLDDENYLELVKLQGECAKHNHSHTGEMCTSGPPLPQGPSR